MILDTNFVSAIINGEEEAWDKAEDLHEEDETVRITEVVLFELFYGAFYDENEKLVREVSNIATMYEMENLDEDSIIEGAQKLSKADLDEGGESGVEPRDGMIGGIAAQNGEDVVTENVDDFNKLDVDVREFNSDN